MVWYQIRPQSNFNIELVNWSVNMLNLIDKYESELISFKPLVLTHLINVYIMEKVSIMEVAKEIGFDFISYGVKHCNKLV